MRLRFRGRFTRSFITAIIYLLIFVIFSCFLVVHEGFLRTSAEDVSLRDVTPFNSYLDDLTRAQQSLHNKGGRAFQETTTVAMGLGPLFNHSSCNGCHPRLRRGHPSTNVTRFGRVTTDGGFDYMFFHGGPQLQTQAIPGYTSEQLPGDVDVVSQRGGPMLLGIGLIEAIPDETILNYEDPSDQDGDGVSGRASFVEPPEYLELTNNVKRNGKYLGRFGRKAASINLLHQTVSSYFNDMGISSDFSWSFISDSANGHVVRRYTPDPEIPAEKVRSVVFYLRTLRPPPRRNKDHPIVQRGEKVFAQIGCVACHVPEMHTGRSDITQLSFKAVALYSDLLLHDMGPKLADGYPEGEASAREWRTTPLWGLGLVESTSFYLHDGRTSDLSEAIQYHGGEAGQARERFLYLDPADRAALLQFLKSL